MLLIFYKMASVGNQSKDDPQDFLVGGHLIVYGRGGEPFSSHGPFQFFQHPPRAVQIIELCLKILKSQPIHLAFLSCCAKKKQPLNPDILP